MRESVAQRRDMALIDDGRESTTPIEPTSNLGGEFKGSRDTLHDNSTDSTSRVEHGSESEDESDIDTNVVYNTRLWAERKKAALFVVAVINFAARIKFAQ